MIGTVSNKYCQAGDITLTTQAKTFEDCETMLSKDQYYFGQYYRK